MHLALQRKLGVEPPIDVILRIRKRYRLGRGTRSSHIGQTSSNGRKEHMLVPIGRATDVLQPLSSRICQLTHREV